MLTPQEYKKLEKYIGGIDVNRMATAFAALGEPNRCLIFRAVLKQCNASVGQLANAVGISESLASQHLKILLQAQLVERKKQGKNVYYALSQNDSLANALKKAVEK